MGLNVTAVFVQRTLEDLEDLWRRNINHKDTEEDFCDELLEFEKKMIETKLPRHKGNIKKTLAALKIPRQTLRDKMNKFDLHRKSFM